MRSRSVLNAVDYKRNDGRDQKRKLGQGGDTVSDNIALTLHDTYVKVNQQNKIMTNTGGVLIFSTCRSCYTMDHASSGEGAGGGDITRVCRRHNRLKLK